MPRPTSLSLDLLQTFILLVEQGGDAAKTAELLGINQPSMSKRLKYFQHAGTVLNRPWLTREGKTWTLTEEGQRVWAGVKDLVYRYDQLVYYLSETGQPDLRFACGQQAAVGFVREALRQFRSKYPDAKFLVSTPRGRARIEGVANGLFDLAVVTHHPDDIAAIARRALHVETIARDRLALVCAAKTPWTSALERLPKTKVSAEAMTSFPLILPEPDAGIRIVLDDILRAQGVLRQLDLRMEIGGWQAILAYVLDGVGVGVISEAAVPKDSPAVVRFLDPSVFPPTEVRLISRHRFDAPEVPDLSPLALSFAQVLKQTAPKRPA